MLRTATLRILLTASMAALLAMPALAGSGWIALDESASSQKTTAEIISSNQDETIVRVTLPGFFFDDVIVNGVTYQTLELTGHANSFETGKPELPVVATLIGIPGSADAQLSVVDSRQITLAGYNVHPHQSQTNTFEIDETVYSQDAFYPSARAEIGRPGIFRDLRVVSLRINPIRFNPATGELAICTDITVRLSHSGTSDVNVKSPSNRPVAARDARLYSDAVLNYNSIDVNLASGLDASAACDLLIVAADDYVDDLAPFVQHKNDFGVVTKVMPVSEVGHTADQIHQSIVAEYFVSGFRYLLLVGNEIDIPAPIPYETISDFCYTLAEGDDSFPEYSVGRFCVDNSDQLGNMIRKTINYEANPPQTDWLKRVCLVTDCYMTWWPYLAMAQEIENAVLTETGTYSVLLPEFTTCHATYDYLGGDEATNTDLISAINAGQRMLFYTGHGVVEGWPDWTMLEENFFAAEIGQLDNGDMTPIVTSFCPYNAKFDDDVESMGETFTHAENGAVAFLGNAHTNVYGGSTDITTEWYYSQWLYSAIFDEEYNTMGDAFMRCAARFASYNELNSAAAIACYHLLGDPSMEIIYDLQPAPPAPMIVSPDTAYAFDPQDPVTLSWTEVAEAISYTVELNDDYAFRNEPLMMIEGIEDTEVMIADELPEGRYHWRVRSHTETRYSVWSDGSLFYVGVRVGVPSLVYPIDGAVLENNPDLEFMFTRVTGPDVLAYWINFYDDPECTNGVMGGYLDKWMCRGKDCTWLYSWNAYGLPGPGTYYWRVKAIGENGDNYWPYSEVWSFTITDPVVEAKAVTGIPATVELRANYPNPFNPSTEICFGLPTAQHAKLEIFNIQGQRVTTLVDEVMSAGYHTISWDGSNAATGVYLYRLSTEDEVIKKKMLLMK